VFARVASYEIDLEKFGPVADWFNEHGEALNEQLAGYQGSLTLIDHASSQMIGIGLYDTEDDARKVDAIMDQGPPKEMPEELNEIMMSGKRISHGIYKVVQSAGRLAAD
jgi:hypothetical protein